MFFFLKMNNPTPYRYQLPIFFTSNGGRVTADMMLMMMMIS